MKAKYRCVVRCRHIPGCTFNAENNDVTRMPSKVMHVCKYDNARRVKFVRINERSNSSGTGSDQPYPDVDSERNASADIQSN